MNGWTLNEWIWIIPLISAFAGWLIGCFLLFFLFHPYQPIIIIGFPIQGLFPRRQGRIAAAAGKFAAQELISSKDISSQFANARNMDSIIPLIETHIDYFLRHKLGKAMPMIGMFIGDKTIAELKGIFMKELEEILPQVMSDYAGNLQKNFDIENFIGGKIIAIPPHKLKLLAFQAIGKELRRIPLATMAVGFLIGLLQLFIIVIVSHCASLTILSAS